MKTTSASGKLALALFAAFFAVALSGCCSNGASDPGDGAPNPFKGRAEQSK